MDAFIGELAGLGTSFMYSLSSTFFTIAGREIRSIVLNRVRLVFAILLLILAHTMLNTPLPFHAEGRTIFWLGLSGALGLTLGDLLLYEGYARIGPRLTMLMMSLAPVLSTILAALFLAERLSAGQILGILITVGGIIWVVLEKNGKDKLSVDARDVYIKGLLCGLGAATAQAVGLITAKRGLGPDVPALSAALIRMTAAGVVLWILAVLFGQVRATVSEVTHNKRNLVFIFCGAIVGPLIGVTLSMVALQYTEVGIASTLMALPPIILLPIGYFFFKERFGWQAVLGTLVAVGGVGVLFLV